MHCYTPSPGGKHRHGVGLRGPVQARRESGTLTDMRYIVNMIFMQSFIDLFTETTH
jgi:hypothetical protein